MALLTSSKTFTMAKEKLLSCKDELKNYQFWKAVRCEFLVTMLLIFVGCGSWTHSDNSSIRELKIALCFGLAVATLVQCVGHISGAHLNPAVTMAMLVTRNLSILRAIFYMIAQCVGGIAGAGILYGLTPNATYHSLGVASVRDDMPLAQAFGMEFMITFIMVFTVFANVDPRRADMGSRSLAIGLSYTLGNLLALNTTGACMNPARALGPALVMNIWKHQWLYWIGPLLGGIIGGFTYEYTHDSSEQLQYFKRSFRRKKTAMQRSRSIHSSNSTVSTEMTFTPTSEDLVI
ncbi:aquaporin-4-like [Lineus longissimus]|uniref:aquaporin-4-like n=1 Tax=Lineus longissimus TaxID=88925 RepID=UPI00315CF093